MTYNLFLSIPEETEGIHFSSPVELFFGPVVCVYSVLTKWNILKIKHGNFALRNLMPTRNIEVSEESTCQTLHIEISWHQNWPCFYLSSFFKNEGVFNFSGKLNNFGPKEMLFNTVRPQNAMKAHLCCHVH